MTQKHGLRNDGAPFNEDGKLVNSDKSTKGDGLAVCTCGAHSDTLPNRASRKRWHEWHKENLPAEPTLDDELEDLVGQQEPDIEEEDDLIGDDEPTPATNTVPWTTELAGIFWGICGNKGSKVVLAAYHPEVTAKPAKGGEKALVLTGQEDHVAAAIITVTNYWAAAARHFKQWKKDTPEYYDRDQTSAAARRVGYQLTKTFFTDFADAYAAGRVKEPVEAPATDQQPSNEVGAGQ